MDIAKARQAVALFDAAYAYYVDTTEANAEALTQAYIDAAGLSEEEATSCRTQARVEAAYTTRRLAHEAENARALAEWEALEAAHA